MAAPSNDPRATRAHLVLVAEDDAAFREMLVDALGQAGYLALGAETLDEALELDAARGPVDLLLTDVIMPGGSGVELARELSRRHAGLPILYMSGYTDRALRDEGLLPPESAFLRQALSELGAAGT